MRSVAHSFHFHTPAYGSFVLLILLQSFSSTLCHEKITENSNNGKLEVNFNKDATDSLIFGYAKEDEANDQPWSEEKQNLTIQQTLKLLEEGNTKIELSTHEDIVLVLGMTGAGKTTVTHFIAGDDSKLLAYEADEDTFLIRDTNDRISLSTIVSKTIFPELYIDQETNTAFYDCPGFSDTRNTTVEIVNSFFVKKVAERAKRVKILLIVNHGSLKSGVDRKDFMLLLKHTTDLLNNTSKFRDALALVATKVDSTKTDLRIIRGIATFLNRTRTELSEILSGEELLKAEQLIDALLTSEKDADGNDIYSRITFFKQPNEPGPLSLISTVQRRKGHIKHAIENGIRFVETANGDFGFTLSHKAQNDIQKLVDAVGDQIYNYFQQLSEELKDHFAKLMHKPSPSQFLKLQADYQVLKDTSIFLKRIENDSYHNYNSIYANLLLEPVNHLKSLNCISAKIPQALVNNGEYLDFLRGVTRDSNSNSSFFQYSNLSRRWYEPLRNFLSLNQALVSNLCLRTESQAENSIGKMSDNVLAHFKRNFNAMKTNENLNLTKKLHHLLSTLEDIERLEASTKPSETIKKIFQTTNKFDATILTSTYLENFSKISIFLDTCNEIAKEYGSRVDSLRWMSRFKAIVSHVQSNFELADTAIHSRINRALTNMSESCVQYYRGRFENYSSTSKDRIRDPLEMDLQNFLLVFHDVKNYSLSDNERTDVEFLQGVSGLILKIVENGIFRTTIQNYSNELKEQVENLQLIRRSRPDLRFHGVKGNIWLDLLEHLTFNVGKQFTNYFQLLDRNMSFLMTKASSKLQSFYQNKFNQLSSSSSTDSEEFKQQTLFLLTNLREIEISNSSLIFQRPSKFLQEILTRCNYLSGNCSSIFEKRFTEEVTETTRCLDLVEIFNMNVEIAKARSHGIVNDRRIELSSISTNQSQWLNKFQAFVPVTKLNFTPVWDALQSRIENSIKNLTSLMETFYESKFEQASQSQPDSKYSITNLKPSLQDDLSNFLTIIERLNYTGEHRNASELLYETAKKFSLPVDSPAELLNALSLVYKQISALGDTVDFTRNYITSLDPTLSAPNWFNPLHSFASELNSTINSPLICSQNNFGKGNFLVIDGTFVRISEALKLLHENSSCLQGSTETMVINSLHTVVIDADIIPLEFSPKQMDVTIVAPHWILEGVRSINLNGAQGRSHTSRGGTNKKNGKGLNGYPGEPGENAGSFLGVGQTLNSVKLSDGSNAQLQILASGGRGGGGQNGGDGRDGTPGENVTLDKIAFEVTSDGLYSNKITITKHLPFNLRKAGRKCKLIFDIYSCTEYAFNGTKGGPGKNGGNGGAGGFGGEKGLITLLGPSGFTEKFNTVENHDGSVGPGGEGGMGGSGGLHGFNAMVHIYPGKHNEDGYIDGKKLVQPKLQGYAPKGSDGNSSVNAAGRKKPLPKNNSSSDQASAVNLFRNLARRSFQNPFIKAGLPVFLSFLDQQDLERFARSSLSLMNLMDEFLDLESQYFELRSRNISCMQFYQDFASKINTLLNSDNSKETKKVLTYLYTASLSRMNTFDSTYDSYLITNMVGYLDLVRNNLENYKQQSNNFHALSLIRNVTEDHTNEIQLEIQTAHNFIAREIYPEIQRLMDELDSGVDRLLNEILQVKSEITGDQEKLEGTKSVLMSALEQKNSNFVPEMALKAEAAKRSRALLARKQAELKDTLVESKVVRVLRVGSLLLGLMTQRGVIIGCALSKCSRGRSEDSVTAMQVQMSKDFIQENMNQVSNFLVLLTDVRQKLMQDPVTFEEVLGTIDEIMGVTEMEILKWKLQLKTLETEGPYNKEELQRRMTGQELIRIKKAMLRSSLRTVEGTIRRNINGTNTNSTTYLNECTISNINTINRIYDDLQLLPDFYVKIRADREKIDQVDAAMKGSQKKLQQLEAFSEKVENEMTAVLDQFHEDLGVKFAVGENGTLESTAATSIDFTQWQISMRIRDMKSLIRSQFTGNFTVDNEISLAFQKLEEGFTVLAQVYDRIANSQKESKLANYIARINSASLETVDFEDPVLREKVMWVELVIVSNVIISRYHMIVNSLKMATFPFAKHYLQGLSIPDKLIQVQGQVWSSQRNASANSPQTIHEYDSNELVQELAKQASMFMNSLRSKVIEGKTTQKANDVYVTRTTFISKSKSSVPFFVWEHSKFQFVIRRLLAGESVVLNADILKSPANYDAVKMSRVGLNFSAVDIDSDLDVDGNSRERLSQEFRNELDHYCVKMTHLGNSAYKYGDKYYSITSSHITFYFSFEEDTHERGLPRTRNDAYVKMDSGDILLSPYSMWKIQLIACVPGRNFSRLSGLALSDDFHFDLELVGKGSYVQGGHEGELKLEDYYKVDESIGGRSKLF